MKKVLLPGSYDPTTCGHVDIIRRCAEMYDEVVVGIFVNPEKRYMFSEADRLRMLIAATREFKNVRVVKYGGMVIDFCRSNGISLIVKGIRNNEDLAYEEKMAEWNFIHGGVKTEFMRSDERYRNTSSTLVRRCIESGEALDGLVPGEVEKIIRVVYMAEQR